MQERLKWAQSRADHYCHLHNFRRVFVRYEKNTCAAMRIGLRSILLLGDEALCAPDDVLEGLIAHELGHLQHRDESALAYRFHEPTRHRMEFEADAKGAQILQSKDQMARALRYLRDKPHKKKRTRLQKLRSKIFYTLFYRTKIFADHPTYKERIQRIEALVLPKFLLNSSFNINPVQIRASAGTQNTTRYKVILVEAPEGVYLSTG